MLLDFDKHFKTFYNALKVKLKNHRGNWNQNDSNADDYIKGKTHWIDNDGNIHPLDERYIPDTIARTSDVTKSLSSKAEAVHSHGISDVNGLQTALDGKASSWNDLTDKPFYEETEYIEVLNVTDVSLSNTNSKDQYIRDRGIKLTLKDDTTYIVRIGGNEYTVRSYKATVQSQEVVVIGGEPESHGMFMKSGSSYPFSMYSKSSGTLVVIWHEPDVVESRVTLSITIHEVVENIKLIDPKFLPFTNAEGASY